MQTKEIENFYNSFLKENDKKYEDNRWFKNSQSISSYKSTLDVVSRIVLPIIEKNFSVLEVGPGPGTWTKVLLSNKEIARYDIVDISEEMLRQAKDNLHEFEQINFVHSDILDFVPKEQYDFFFSSRFIEYVNDKEKVVDTIFKSLKPGGKGYLSTKTPQYGRFMSKKVNSPVHQGQISAKKLRELFERRGFKVKKIINVNSVFPGLNSGLLDRILTIICRYIPFEISRHISESYAIIFQKNS